MVGKKKPVVPDTVNPCTKDPKIGHKLIYKETPFILKTKRELVS